MWIFFFASSEPFCHYLIHAKQTKPQPLYNTIVQNRVITNRVIKRLKCTVLSDIFLKESGRWEWVVWSIRTKYVHLDKTPSKIVFPCDVERTVGNDLYNNINLQFNLVVLRNNNFNIIIDTCSQYHLSKILRLFRLWTSGEVTPCALLLV